MSTRFERHEPATGCGLVARVKAGQPAVAWDEAPSGPGEGSGQAPAIEAPSTRGDEGLRRDPRKGQVAFYDREALREQIRALQNETRGLSSKEVDLRMRLTEAQETLSVIRMKKRELSEEQILNEAASIVPAKVKVLGRRHRDSRSSSKNRDGAGNSHEVRDRQRQEETNFSAQDRIMELELLNDQLRKGQGEAERKAKVHQPASNATRADVQKVAQRVQAMPRRFTQNLKSLREEVDRLEREKLSLELAKQQRTLKEADLVASAKRQQAYLREELTALLDEIDDVEEDRDRCKRRLRVESTRTGSLRSQRDEALGALRQRFGGDAVERAAFAFFSSSVHHKKTGGGRGGAERGGRGASGEVPLDEDGGCDGPSGTSGDFGGYGDDECPSLPASMVAKALRPAYGPDYDYTYDGGVEGGDGDYAEVFLTAEAVAEAVASECGTDPSTMGEGERQGLGLPFEEFLAVAERITKRKANHHVTRCD